jgi:hypothetical protein
MARPLPDDVPLHFAALTQSPQSYGEPIGRWRSLQVSPPKFSVNRRLKGPSLLRTAAHAREAGFGETFLEESAEEYPFEYAPELSRDLVAYLPPCPTGPRFAALIESIRRDILYESRRSVDILVDTNQLYLRLCESLSTVILNP